MTVSTHEMAIVFIVASLWIGIIYVYCVYMVWNWIRSMTIRVWPIPEGFCLENDIYSILSRASDSQACIDADSESEYILFPSIPRMVWKRLGDALTANEHLFRDVPDNCYYTIRLDGKNFRSVIPRLTPIFGTGYSHVFDICMQQMAMYLMPKCNAVYAYVHSDEVTLLISPHISRKTKQFVPHQYKGRHDKLVTLISGFATQYWNRYVAQRMDCTEPDLPDILFDARIGVYPRYKDAFSLLLWRSYDCSVNSISTTFYLNHLPGSLENVSTKQRISILKRNGILDTMTPHQKYGTLLYRKKREACDITSPPSHAGQSAYEIVHIPGNVARNIKENRIDGFRGFEDGGSIIRDMQSTGP